MNVKKLKELLKDLPDDMKVVTSAFDHSYRNVDGWVADALDSNGDMTEWTGGEPTEEERNIWGDPTKVFVID